MNVWQAMLDNRYDCEVVQDFEVNEKGYAGRLTVKDTQTGQTLLDVPVGIAFAAVLGPDIDDVRTWEEMAIEAVDKWTSKPSPSEDR